MDDELLRFARLAMAVARPCVPRRLTRFAHPTHPPAGLFAALLPREHPRPTCRGLEDLLRLSGRPRRPFGLRVVPDHSTLWRFARRRLSDELIAAAPGETVRRAGGAGGAGGGGDHGRQVALDSTGLWLSYTSRYFAWRAKRDRGQRGWLKWAFATWVGPRMLLAQRVRPGPCGDFSDLAPPASAAAGVMSFDRLVADAGYDSEADHRFCREQLGVDSLIPAEKRRSAKVIATTPHRREMCRRLGELGEPADRAAYGRRWKVETVMSVVKRRCGEAPTARLEPTRRAQALLRGVGYNVQRLVRLGAAA